MILNITDIDPGTQRLVAETARLVQATATLARWTFGLALGTAILAISGIATAIAAFFSVKVSQRTLIAMGEEVAVLNKQTEALHDQRKAQIRPMVVYTNEDGPALVNAGNGLALNVKARWQRADTQDPTPHQYFPSMGVSLHVGQVQRLETLPEVFRIPLAVQVKYEDAEGTLYYSYFIRPRPHDGAPPDTWEPGTWKTGLGDGPGLVYDEIGKVQQI